ncbi:IclR family transcriptional regulator [Actinomadura viridis]|uniref:IclR family transcriptional regulator n=1 Tax=Actinomadura viridis TaxID=58110 RepID=UPI003686B833
MADGSIKRTMLILRTLATGGPQTLKQLSDTVGYTPSTVLRFLRILQEEGYVEQNSNRIWQASLETWRMGAAVLAHGGWSRRLNEAVQEISRQTGETSIYSMYADGDIVYIALGASSHTVRTHIELGTRFHASEMSTGRAILGHLPEDEVDALMLARWGAARWKGTEGDAFRRRLLEIRTRGYSSATSERWPGVWGIAAPVFDLEGRAIGALGLSIPPTREPQNEGELARLLIQHAGSLAGAAPR